MATDVPVPSWQELLATGRRRSRARRVSSYVVAAIAVVGVLSALSVPSRNRFAALLEVLPFFVTRVAATTLVLVSFALLLTARGLRRGSRLAWVSALLLMGASAQLHLVKAVDVEEAVIAIAALVWLATQYQAFPVLPTRATAARALLVGGGGALVVLTVATSLVMLLNRQDHPRMRQSAGLVVDRLTGERVPLPAPLSFLSPVLVALGLGLVVVTLWILLSPRTAARTGRPEHLASRERARKVVQRYGTDTLDYFALRDDKQWFFVGDSVVAYAVRTGVCLVSPDPIGPASERGEAWTAFTRYAAGQGWSVAVVAAAEEWLPYYRSAGMRPLYLGDEAVVDCSTFTLQGRSMKGLRAAHNRVVRAGYTATFHDPSKASDQLRESLVPLLSQSRRGDRERGFSMTLSRLFDPTDTGLLLAVAQRADGSVGAFIQWVPAASIDGWSLDVMRRSTAADAPNGLTDFLIIETIKRIASEGGRGLGLNFAVLRTVVAGESEGWAARFGQRLLGKVAADSQVASLWKFNAKYDPSWRPRYLVVDSLEFALTQGVVMAEAEGLDEVPLLGRFFSRARK